MPLSGIEIPRVPKVTEFKVKYRDSCKLFVLNSIIEQVCRYNYLEIGISYEAKCDVNNESLRYEGA